MAQDTDVVIVPSSSTSASALLDAPAPGACPSSDAPTSQEPWRRFQPGNWNRKVDVRDFIIRNVSPYHGNEDFLAASTSKTKLLWAKVLDLMAEEREKGGVLDCDTSVVSSILSHGPGYIDRNLECVVGLQTDKPLKRALMPFGGLRMAEEALEAYGYTMDPALKAAFQSTQRRTQNDAIFDAYDDEARRCRKSHVLTGLPDTYGRGRIIGDYRRVALYGLDRLIADKKEQQKSLGGLPASAETVQFREEIAAQITSLRELAELGDLYGFDLRRPAANATQAFQWLYLAYLAAVKEQNGAAMSLGRVSSFLDIYIQRDLREGTLNEPQAQELVDHLVMKCRMVRFARTPAYNAVFSGDPTWVTECIGGMALDGRTLVTRNSYRFLHTLTNLGPAPEPNLTVLWSERLPEPFKAYCARVSISTSAIQYENDDLMTPIYGDDYGIACCVSAMRLGKQMQFFGARANLAKCLLYAINGGKDELTGDQVGPTLAPITGEGPLDYAIVAQRFDAMMDWLATAYVRTLNTIHCMHDRYNYERLEMALHDRDVYRTLACGIAGLSVVADSLSAIRYAKVYPIRDERGLAVSFRTEGEFPTFGNDDDRVDTMAVDIVEAFMDKLRRQPTYRNAVPTQSVLTITSNVVYGKNTGDTPDGRRFGEPFAPGANPMHGRDHRGAWASLASVAKIPYASAQDGISNTFSIIPEGLGLCDEDRISNLIGLLDGYFERGGFHLNVNVLNREMLVDAMDHPEKYPQLTIRVSGYAVNFIKLTREQQLDVVNRTFHERS